MPALPDAPQVLKVEYLFSWDEDTLLKCREFFRYTGGPPTDADLTTWSTTITTAWDAEMKGLHSSHVVLTGVKVTDLTSPTSAVGENLIDITGTRSGAPMGAENAVLISQQVHRRYRGGHPRMYLPLGVEGDLADAQTWGPTFRSAVETDRAAFLAAITGTLPSGLSSVVQCNVSYYAGFTVHTGTTGRARNVSTPRSSPLVDVVVAEIVRAGIAVIRKRLLSLA